MKKQFVVMLSTVMLMAGPALGLAAMAGSNTVNSAAIVDGSVATVDIANKAVTAVKIADATITAAQIANKTVTASKIADETITAVQIAGGAVTDAKISGLISTSKLNVGTTAGTVASGNHTHIIGTTNIADGAVIDSKISGPISSAKIAGLIGVEKIGTYTGVMVVHKGAVDGVNTFNTIQSAMNAIPISYPQPGQYIIVLMPGIYNEPSLVTKQCVSIIGADRFNCIINGDISIIGSSLHNVTVNGHVDILPWGLEDGVSNCHLNSSGGIGLNVHGYGYFDNIRIQSDAVGLYIDGTYRYTIGSRYTNIDIEMRGSNSTGIYIDGYQYNFGGPFYIGDIRISGATKGISFLHGYVTINNVIINSTSVAIEAIGSIGNLDCYSCILTAIGSNGIAQSVNAMYSRSPMAFINSALTGNVYSNAPQLIIGNSKVNGTFTVDSWNGYTGSIKTANCYDGDFMPIVNGFK
jgi:hypothetical protein